MVNVKSYKSFFNIFNFRKAIRPAQKKGTHTHTHTYTDMDKPLAIGKILQICLKTHPAVAFQSLDERIVIVWLEQNAIRVKRHEVEIL